MSSLHPITIVGGGLAGLTLGIALRRREVPVVVWEAGEYPRHRVCGEFISGAGQGVLDRLGLRSHVEEAGAFRAATVQFIAGPRRSPVWRMPVAALCLSRYDLDALLASEFQRLGGDLRISARWTGPFGEAIVRASGRQPQPTENGWRWFGLKVHARNVPLAADLEMYVSDRGYVGANRINNGQVNVCGLFRSRRSEGLASRMELLRGVPGSPLFERLESALFDTASSCSVAGLSLTPRRAAEREELCLGDALTMIPPITGNGMSMALESAELAAEPLEAYSRGDLTWTAARETAARTCDAAFANRLVWARCLQWLMFSPMLRTAIGGQLLKSDRLWRTMWTRTR